MRLSTKHLLKWLVRRLAGMSCTGTNIMLTHAGGSMKKRYNQKGEIPFMNKIILTGRLTRDPEIRYAQQSNTAIARYTLAVDRQVKREGEPQADFLRCVAFGRTAEFAEQYLRKGTKIAVTGRIQTGSYTNSDGQRVYTTDVVIESQEFCESKAACVPAAQNSFADSTFMPDGQDESQYQYFN